MRKRFWTLNDAIAHHKHGFITESEVEMNLSFQTHKGAETIAITTVILDLNDLLKKDLVYEEVLREKKGFRLRFVHDPSDHRIYIQRPSKGAPRMFVGEVLTNAL